MMRIKIFLSLIITLLALGAYSQDGYIVKKNNLVKSFKLQASDQLEITNYFGSVHIHTWQYNEVRAKIEITTYGKTEEMAQEFIDNTNILQKIIKHIDIDSPQAVRSKQESAARLTLSTEIYTPHNRGNGVRKLTNNEDPANSEINVVYQVYLPATLPLKISQTWGKVYIDDFSGDLDVKVHGGALQAAKLIGENITISIHRSFGESTIDAIESNHVKIDVIQGEKIKIGK